MKTRKITFPIQHWFQGVFAIIFLGALTGCPNQQPPPPAAAAPAAPAPQVVAAPPAVVVEPPVADGLIYYPDYEVYFDPVAQVYWCNRGGAWVSGPAPFGVSIDVLLRSPSAHMGFRDSPANHHADVVRQYPHGWKPDDRH